jgi:hypothetical protein
LVLLIESTWDSVAQGLFQESGRVSRSV